MAKDPRSFMGDPRRLGAVALALALVAIVTRQGAGAARDGELGLFLAVAAGVLAALLAAGWWLGRDRGGPK